MEVQVLSFAPAHEVSTTFSPRCSKLQSDLELPGHRVDPSTETQLAERIRHDAGKSSSRCAEALASDGGPLPRTGSRRTRRSRPYKPMSVRTWSFRVPGSTAVRRRS